VQQPVVGLAALAAVEMVHVVIVVTERLEPMVEAVVAAAETPKAVVVLEVRELSSSRM
jgi:hypothetical protein